MLQPKKNRKSAEMAALLEEYEGRAPAPRAGFQPGEHVHGRVVSVGDRVVTIDLDAKTPGVIDRAAFGEELPLPEPGDEIDAYFVALEDGAARLSLSGGAQLDASDEAIGAAMAAGVPLEGKYEKEVNGGFEVRVNGQRAFCPYSQVALHRPREGAPSPVGTTDTFLVVEYNPAERTLVVSHRAVEEKDRALRRETLRSSLFEGDLRNGVVTKVMPFGAFVDIGGVEGLVPAAEISWDRSVKPEDVLHEGDEVQVKVRRIDWENERFTFSLKDLSKDPWQAYCEDFAAGSYVSGRVVKLMPFGAFVQLVPGVDGLLPIATLGRGRHIVDPGEVVKVGQEVDVRIESMDPVARRISLSLVDSRVRALKPGEIAPGAVLKGIVESCREFGVFVRLSEDRTGLLHVSEAGVPKGTDALAALEAKYPVGSEIEVRVKEVGDGRVSLALRNERVEALRPGEIAVGAVLKGIVESSTDFGVFVRLSEDRTGLLHVSEAGIPKGVNAKLELSRKFPDGADVEVVVKAVDGDRVSLALPSVIAERVAADADEADLRARMRANRENASSSGFGSFGDLLDAALGGSGDDGAAK